MRRRALLAAGGAALAAACLPRRRPPAAGLEADLAVYIWSDYLAPNTVPAFEDEFGVRVTVDTFESNEEMLAKLQSGATGYDVVVPTAYLLPVMVSAGLLQPLRRELLPNWRHLAPLFVPRDGPAAGYGMPYQWGLTGIAWRTDLLRDPPASWAVFLDPAHRRRMTQMDDGREVLGAMLRLRGHSVNTTDPALLAGARADALAAKANLKAYISAPVKGSLITGDVWLAQIWNGDAAQARAEEPAIAFAVPREGSTIWTDYMAIPRAARHPRAAHAFLDFLLRPDVGAEVSDFTGYGSPSEAALARQRSPVPFPEPAELARLEYQADLGAATELWDRIWTEVKAG